MPTAPVPARVDAATKGALLGLVEHATDRGWPVEKACAVLGLDVRRARRWTRRRETDAAAGLVDARPGASVNALRPAEVEAIVSAFETFGEKDFSHRRLAHRGSYEGLFWAAPSTVRRVLNDHDLRFRHPPRPPRGQRRPFPDWASYTPGSIWIYDTTHFVAAGVGALFVEDLVSRKWITTVVSAEETHTQVQLAFEHALEVEGLLEPALERAEALGRDLELDGEDALTPILLAVSDNGSQMISANTRKFMAMYAIAQHFGRPSTPTDQAWVESLNGTVKAEWPHLTKITDPAVLRAELDVARTEYNTTRLHSALGYVTPDDEHHGRGEAIRQARRDGLARAAQARLAYNRNQRKNQPNPEDPDVV
ncbi:integrase core domain-containing protein [Acidipropionibacterium thoenii]|uniref:integrase core domain-containing protein n=1 Tax=Acidipropionibacterium thoenii TaxID=1751 RepID=UPI000A0283B2|nr:integrase core domain-containing protein [Acidipropionibacterium thoenii]